MPLIIIDSILRDFGNKIHIIVLTSFFIYVFFKNLTFCVRKTKKVIFRYILPFPCIKLTYLQEKKF